MGPDEDDVRREAALEQENLKKIRDAVDGGEQEALEKKLNRFEDRVEEIGEEKKQVDPTTKAQFEKQLQQFKGAAGAPIAPGQQGPLSIMVGHTKDLKKVVIDFKQPIQFLQFTPQEAFGLSKVLRKNAKKCRG